MTMQSFYRQGTDNIMIIKPNTLIEAGFDLTEAEHDLMTLAVNKLHRLQFGGRRVLISAKEFAAANRVNETYAYRALKDTAKVLGDRKLKFTLYLDKTIQATNEADKLTVIKPSHHNFTTLRSEYHWLQGVSYQDEQGFIILDFSDPLTFLIDNTSKAYTRYDFIKTVGFTGCSSKRLYELINKWKGMGEIPEMTIEAWKEFFGVSDKYPKIAEFKRRILDPAINQINKQGDFKLTLKASKFGRTITHFSITIKTIKSPDKQAEQNTKPDKKLVKLLTANQANVFAKKLANDGNFGSKYARVGESPNSFINRLNDELQRDLLKVDEYLPYLEKLGFKACKGER